MGDYQKQMIRKLAEKIKAEGFRVFIAERGTYGFFTDAGGTRVVSFGMDLTEIAFSGNYVTSAPKNTGTGWRIAENVTSNFANLFNAYAPQWAVGSATWKYKTLEKYLAEYQQSSKFLEV